MLVLLLGLAVPANSLTLADLIKDHIWRTNTSEELKQLFNQFESEFQYLRDNSIEAKLNDGTLSKKSDR